MELIEIMCFSAEYALFPVRHNEDKTNMELVSILRYKTSLPMDSPHLKVILLIYVYLYNLEPPTREYSIDTKTVLDQALRILQGMLDIATNSGWLSVSLRIATLLQMIIQGFFVSETSLNTLPHVEISDISCLQEVLDEDFHPEQYFILGNMKELHNNNSERLYSIFDSVLGATAANDIDKFLVNLPIITINLTTEDETTEVETDIDLMDNKMYSFAADSVVKFKFQLNRKGPNSLEVHSNRFPKQKEESWILFVGLPEEDQLLASKKVSFKTVKTTTVNLKMPSEKG